MYGKGSCAAAAETDNDGSGVSLMISQFVASHFCRCIWLRLILFFEGTAAAGAVKWGDGVTIRHRQ